jgi:hypothetical protein
VQGAVTRARPQQRPPAPEDDPVGRATLVVLNWLATKLPAAAATRAAEAGFDRIDVTRIYELCCTAAESEVRGIIETMNISCPVADSWAEAKFPPFDAMPAVQGEPA